MVPVCVVIAGSTIEVVVGAVNVADTVWPLNASGVLANAVGKVIVVVPAAEYPASEITTRL
jgi:hypothetical protein